MQIRHSYSIGSIVPFSSSTTFTSTNENKDSSKCISYRPGPHFLTCKYNFVSPTGVSGWKGAFPWARWRESLHPLLREGDGGTGTLVPFASPRCLVLKGSPTSNAPTARKNLQLACTGASYGMGLQATGGFPSVPERRSGHCHGSVLANAARPAACPFQR